jgi:ribosomal protein L11
MANVVVSAIATFNGKALKKGQKELSAFDKQAQQLGRTFSRVFAATAIVAFSKKAINAFAADEKAAKSLAVQLENTGNAFRVNEVEAYISSLQNLYGVLDDQLRPAFQTLLNATGSVTLSQKALETALNVSAGTGKDLESVVAAIAKGASGTTTALARLGTGLDKATIASGDMNKIMAALDKKFAGQAQARLTTYAGKMDLLKVAAANATEIIGKGLIDAISAIGKDNSIDQAANSMNGFANAIANTAKGMGELIAQVKGIIDSDVGKFLLGLTALLTLGKKQLITGAVGLIAYDIGKNPKAISESENRLLGQKRLADRVKESKLIKDSVTYRTAENATLKAKTEMDKLKDKFDLERIGLTTALNAATDEETKLRINAKIAILDNNEALAKKINAELEAAKNATLLADAFGGAANALTLQISKMQTMNDALIGKINAKIAAGAYVAPSDLNIPGINASSASPLETQIQKLQSLTDTIKQKAALKGIDTSTVDYSIMPTLANGMLDLNAPQNAASARLQAQADAYFKGLNELKITVDTTNTGDRFAQLIAESLQAATKSGLSSTPVGLP